MSVWNALFGAGTWGTGGNLIAGALCSGLSVTWLHVKAVARHREQMAKAEEHHEALTEHITATGTVPPPTQEGNVNP